MRQEDRPFIEFRRKVNKGISARPEKKNEKGVVTRAAHPGEFTEVWRKHLVSHRPPFDPYSWVGSDWVLSKISPDCIPVGMGNLDKLPADYPKTWREKLQSAFSVVAGQVQANRQMMQAQEENERLREELTRTNGEANGKAELRQPPTSGREAPARLQRTQREAGQATERA